MKKIDGFIPRSKLFSLPARLGMILLILAMAQLACNMPGQSTTSSDAQFTIVAQTVEAELTQTAMMMSPGGTPGASQPTNGQNGATPTNTITVLPVFTSTPGSTATPKPTSTPKATATPIPCNWASFIKDITVPDNTKKDPGVSFDKTWRLKNIGSCPWTSGYRLVFDHGDQMGAPAELAFTSGVVNPGNVVDITVPLVAPASAGTYQGFFKLKSSDGKIFGIGNTANKPFWVKIKVKQPPVSKADLVIKNIEFVPSLPSVGEVVTVLITLKNDGDTRAENFRVVWYPYELSMAPACEWNHVNAYNPGEERMLVPCSYTYTNSGSDIETVAYVDVDDNVEESNEGNNTFSKMITVVP